LPDLKVDKLYSFSSYDLCKCCNNDVVCNVCRRLTAQQKALILAYAETETGVDGTVNGIASTKDGMIHQSNLLWFSQLLPHDLWRCEWNTSKIISWPN